MLEKIMKSEHVAGEDEESGHDAEKDERDLGTMSENPKQKKGIESGHKVGEPKTK